MLRLAAILAGLGLALHGLAACGFAAVEVAGHFGIGG